MPIRNMIHNFMDNNKKIFTPGILLAIFCGTAINTFGLYNIHQQTNITEGGVPGMILLLNYWTGIPQSVFSLILDISAYAMAYKYLGKDFIKISFVAAFMKAGFFRLWEQFPPMLPNLSAYPLIASIVGAIFIGAGCGLIVRYGGSSSGDDALALTISKRVGWRVSYAYLIIDFTVLALSLTYIPLHRIGFSLVTVTVSSMLIDFIQSVGFKRSEEEPPITLPRRIKTGEMMGCQKATFFDSIWKIMHIVRFQ